jgi:hypothetical protein
MFGGCYMTVNVSSIGLKGLEGYRVQVQVRISPGKESMVIVGLPDASVKESRERVLAALSHFGEDVTDQKVVVNLSPPEVVQKMAQVVNSYGRNHSKKLGNFGCKGRGV